MSVNVRWHSHIESASEGHLGSVAKGVNGGVGKKFGRRDRPGQGVAKTRPVPYRAPQFQISQQEASPS